MINKHAVTFVISFFLTFSSPLLSAECTLYTTFKTAYENNNTEPLKIILKQLDQSACSVAEKDKIRYLSAKIVYQQLAQQAPTGTALLNAYTDILTNIHGMFWPVLIDQGDSALADGDYPQALNFYQKALLAIDDHAYTPIGEPQFPQLIPQLHKKASASRLAAASMTQHYIEPPHDKAGKPSGIANMLVRGVTIEEVDVPILFDYNETQLREADQQYAAQLYSSLKAQNFPAIRLTGHSDTKGEQGYNQKLSKKRAQTVKDYLKQQGYRHSIEVQGAGEMSPPDIIDKQRLTDSQWRQACRRVEVTHL
jgi:outer membrane protein OmpA-like peptidoglycan-associated protein